MSEKRFSGYEVYQGLIGLESLTLKEFAKIFLGFEVDREKEFVRLGRVRYLELVREFQEFLEGPLGYLTKFGLYAEEEEFERVFEELGSLGQGTRTKGGGR